MAIDITLHETAGSVRIVVTGDVDLATAEHVERALLRAEDRSQSIVLDLSAVDFFDSTGLSILLDADHRARDNGHKLVVVAGRAVVESQRGDTRDDVAITVARVTDSHSG